MEVKASIKFARLGAQKTRLVADLVRGKNVNEALKTLKFMDQKPAGVLTKLIKSAVANAEQKKVVDVDNLYIKTLLVDQGPVMKRYIPKAQGSAQEIRKKTSHINLVLDER